MTREELGEIDEIDTTISGGKKLRLRIESLGVAIRRKVKQRQQKKARMLNRRK